MIDLRASELAVDVVGTAVGRKLVGELAMFPFQQDGLAHYALGQITEIELRNVWHEDPTMRSLIRQRGRIDAVSERQDNLSRLENDINANPTMETLARIAQAIGGTIEVRFREVA